ncbi:cytochrome P450 [Bimuria novae-zelandiae CBS 107.79]|uniref:Cytochrome P450 n=1 Tax=Bimuria novae-zelandiae CBS 107.79 TaxID=1447943 RepID=A0A6A5V956_9PLEO|nr:cytochrome P450 [Bimuria novae-zelandiae CBS 107.79]
MITAIFVTLAVLPTTLVLWSMITLNANLKKARATGLPILVRYITPTNPLWMAFGSNLVRLARRLGIATERFDRFYLFGWDANERYRVHQEFGDVFILVSPGGNWIYISDPRAAWDVLKRPRDFGRNVEQLAVLNVYGKNLSTTEGHEWQKHRKVTAATFTERNNELVWLSSLRQGHEMLDYWLHRAQRPFRSVTDDCKTFTLNVLAAALFTKPYPFEGQEEMKKRQAMSSDKPDDARQYRDSFSKILRGIIPIAIFGGDTLRNSSWMPASMKQVGEAVENFRSYVMSMIEEERSNVQKNITTRKDLVSALVRASLAQQDEGRDMTITEQDIISNTFVYGFAGNDTTAITLAHTIVNLTANPAAQDWIREEIRYYCREDDFTQWPYATWMKLKRCQAVVMETLRLCHPLGSSSKLTKDACTLTVGNNTYTIPPKSNVQVNFCALHTNTSVWGDTAMTWDPTRFIDAADDRDVQPEQLRTFPDGQYIPWSHGERVCPGKRFSQVELAAVLAVLFRKHGVESVPEMGESPADSQKRAQQISLDIQMTLLNEMYQPERLGLKWVEVD